LRKHRNDQIRAERQRYSSARNACRRTFGRL